MTPRFGALFWFVVVVLVGFTTFKAKYAIQDLEEQLVKVRKQTTVEQNEIRVLTAEWTFLNQPERLADLNKRLLKLTPMAANQLQRRIDDIPLRTMPVTDFEQLLEAAAEMPTATPAVATSAATTTLASAPAVAAVPPAPVPVKATFASAQVHPVSPRPAVATMPAAAKPTPPVQLLKATPASLDALIAQIAEVR